MAAGTILILAGCGGGGGVPNYTSTACYDTGCGNGTTSTAGGGAAAQLAVVPASLNFSSTASGAQTFTLSGSGFSSTVTSTTTCASVASVSAPGGTLPIAYTASPRASGTCTIVFSGGGVSATETITVGSGSGSATGSGSSTSGLISPNNANACLSEFYDPATYNWLSIQNTCSSTITVTWILADNTGGAGTWTIAPGSKWNTGDDSTYINQHGGLHYYACPGSAYAVNTSGQVFFTNVSSYLCHP